MRYRKARLGQIPMAPDDHTSMKLGAVWRFDARHRVHLAKQKAIAKYLKYYVSALSPLTSDCHISSVVGRRFYVHSTPYGIRNPILHDIPDLK